jgi:hypothetical protein
VSERRRARDFDRQFARELARLYRLRHPRREPDERSIDSVTPEPERQRRGRILPPSARRDADNDYGIGDIADALDWFAKHGTWERSQADAAPLNAMAYRVYYRRLRAKQMSSEDAINELAETYGVSVQTIRNAIYTRK